MAQHYQPMQPGQPQLYPGHVNPAMTPVYNQQPMPAVGASVPQHQMNPAGQNWMPVPQGIIGCPPGLEYLTQIDQLIVKQKVEALELITGFETSNKYKVQNAMGQFLYDAKEKSGCCARQCCGPLRCFHLTIKDNTKREVIHLERPLNCVGCCFPCCLQEMTVTSPVTGEILGKIKQKWHPCLPKFEIQGASGEKILEMEGPFCTISCCKDVKFPIKGTDGQEVGKITKQWTGFVKEAFTDADNFGVTFPLNLDVKAKATLLGAVFLIDFMYFEHSEDNDWD